MTGEVDLFGEDVTAEMLESYVQKSSTTNMLSQSSCMAALSQIMLATGIDPEKASPAFEPALEMP